MDIMEPVSRAGVIGASSESVYAIEEARKRGIKVIAVDGVKSAPGLQHADEGHVVDIRDIDAVFAFFDADPVDFLLPVPVGRILITSGAVNDRYGLPGIGKRGVDLSTDKWEFHRLLSSKGLRDAEAVLVTGASDIKETESMNYPVIFKPRFGSGSRAVKKYDSYEELLEDTAELPLGEEDFIAETCRQGTEYGVDAAVINGEYRMILLREKILTPPPYRQCVGYYALEKTGERKALFASVDGLVGKVVEVLGIDNCLLHADVLYDGREAFLIEISPRPSGHYLHNYFTRYATGFDMLGAYMDFASDPAARGDYRIDYTYSAKSMLIKYFDLAEGIVRSLPDKAEIEAMPGVICYNCMMTAGDRIGMVTDGRSVMGRGFYIVEGPSLADCESVCKEIENKIEIEEE